MRDHLEKRGGISEYSTKKEKKVDLIAMPYILIPSKQSYHLLQILALLLICICYY